MSVTVGHYVDALLQLVQGRGLQVWVHPAPPVLVETQHVVALFNETLKQQLTLHAARQLEKVDDGGSSSRLHFLDITQQLVEHRDALQLDGTHLHPRYLQYVQSVL